MEFIKKFKDVFAYAAYEEANWKKNLEGMTDYQPFTTFYSDLSIGEWYGMKGIKDTFKNVVKQWGKNYKYFTEFVLCLNHKSWEMYSRNNEEWCELYTNLYYKATEIAEKNFKGDELSYFYNIMD